MADLTAGPATRDRVADALLRAGIAPKNAVFFPYLRPGNPVAADDAANACADLADVLHTTRTHNGGACHGHNDGCQGGPDEVEMEDAEDAWQTIIAALDITEETNRG